MWRCGENEVAGFRCGEGELNGFEVAHLTNHNHVGVLSQRSAKGAAKGLGVRVNFPLVDVATGGFEDILNGVFQGENVVFAVLVDEVDEGGHGSGLS